MSKACRCVWVSKACSVGVWMSKASRVCGCRRFVVRVSKACSEGVKGL